MGAAPPAAPDGVEVTKTVKTLTTSRTLDGKTKDSAIRGEPGSTSFLVEFES